MTTRDPISRRRLLGGLLAGVAAQAAWPALADAPRVSLRPHSRPGAHAALASSGRPDVPSPAELIDRAGLGGTVGYVVVDPKNGRVLDSHNADHPLPCASITKTFTTLYALHRLGPDHRFQTHVVATGPISGGVVQGDLILLGGGDPTLTSDDLADMAAALASKGVRGVTGRYLYDASAIPHFEAMDPDQPPQEGYNPGLSGLNLNFNRVHFQWKRVSGGYQVQMDARGDRVQPATPDITMQIVDRTRPVYTHKVGAQSESWTVAGGVLGRHGARWLPVSNPAPYAAAVFREVAAAYSIRLPVAAPGNTPNGAAVLVTHQSDALTHVLKEMLYYSTNLTAELVGLAASAAASPTRQAPSTLEASAAEMAAWIKATYGVSPRFGDHSGLAPGTRVTAAELGRMLSIASTDDQFRSLLKQIHLLDSRGRLIRNSPLTVHAKTGTLNFVSGLAGYVVGPAQQELVFAILTANMDKRDAARGSNRERPPGMRTWTRHSRQLQQNLIETWAALYREA
ncbi:D-alanyl-D-alanine carboxypeptidase/D-alanyl-D-alanine endopeptidase [Acidimangrovimonas sediminis]|uniref:D-alanyl-D-alanine carboxypeptidase/D-alanyl-D-alanine endopeptidase n=1 Tax=Acidimangrovimonas sediminis TaxID=2056283 RepID=UPI000C7F8EFC|nr:D-alanyl-D-alanine carboxypeptidase/D-alanyl-D-alanine-endopeptidase [Acidimangrovimonas sediminis]